MRFLIRFILLFFFIIWTGQARFNLRIYLIQDDNLSQWNLFQPIHGRFKASKNSKHQEIKKIKDKEIDKNQNYGFSKRPPWSYFWKLEFSKTSLVILEKCIFSQPERHETLSLGSILRKTKISIEHIRYFLLGSIR